MNNKQKSQQEVTHMFDSDDDCSLEVRIASHIGTAEVLSNTSEGGTFYGDPEKTAMISMERLIEEIIVDDVTWSMLTERRSASKSPI